MRSRHNLFLVFVLLTVLGALGFGWSRWQAVEVRAVASSGGLSVKESGPVPRVDVWIADEAWEPGDVPATQPVAFQSLGREAVQSTEGDEVPTRNAFRAKGLVQFPEGFDFARLEYVRVFFLDAETREPLLEPTPVLEDGTWGPVELEVDEGQELVFRTWRGGIAPTEVDAVAPASGAELSIVLTPPMGHDVWFYVTDKEGEVIEGATVEVRFPEADIELEAIVQENRYHFLPGAPAGMGIARASAEGYGTQDGYVVRLPFLEPYTTLITLSTAVEFVGECRYRGEAVEDFEVVWWRPGSTRESLGEHFEGVEQGRFTLDAVPGGPVHMSVRSPDLRSPEARLVEASGEDPVVFEFGDPLPVTGRLVDFESGLGVEGARVQAWWMDGQRGVAPCGGEVWSDRAGEFEVLAGGPGTRLIVEKEGYARRLLPHEGKGLELGDIELTPPYRVGVTLLGSDDPTCFHLWVQGEDQGRRRFASSGKLELEADSPAIAFAIVYPDGSEAWHSIGLHFGGMRRIEHVVGAASLELKLGGDLARKVGSVSLSYPRHQRVLALLAGAPVRMEGLRAGPVSVQLLDVAGEWVDERVLDLVPGENSFPWEVGSARSILRVVGEGGAPLVGADVVLYSEAGSRPDATTDGQGELLFSGEAQDLRARVDQAGGVLGSGLELERVGDARYEVSLEDAASMEVVVTDEGAPLAGVKGRLVDLDLMYIFDEERRTDGAGRAVWERVVTGRYNVVLTRPGYWTAYQDLSTGSHFIELRRLGDLDLEVVTESGKGVPGVDVAMYALDMNEDRVSSWLADGLVTASGGRLRTDRHGRLGIQALPRGTFRVVAGATEVDVLVRGGDRVRARIQLAL